MPAGTWGRHILDPPSERSFRSARICMQAYSDVMPHAGDMRTKEGANHLERKSKQKDTWRNQTTAVDITSSQNDIATCSRFEARKANAHPASYPEA